MKNVKVSLEGNRGRLEVVWSLGGVRGLGKFGEVELEVMVLEKVILC